MPELLFHGAAGEVTGSMHMILTTAGWIALDCGMFQGRRADAEEKNRQWPVPPPQIRAVVVSHAHIDHTGRLPKLVRDGFTGPIYCTAATRDLSAIMLPDSAHIQTEDVPYVNKKRARQGLPPIEALYDEADAVAAVEKMRGVSYNEWFTVFDGFHVRYQDAGHMLGSAGVQIGFGSREKHDLTLYFTGDLGSRNKPILRDPAPLPPADVVISESTYGGRVNESTGDAREVLVETAKRTFARGGKLIVPAFSVGRTQTMTYFLNEDMDAGRVPRVPVIVDSPLAASATEIYKLHPDCYDADARALQGRTGDALGKDVIYTHTVEESKALNNRRDPCIIISASGMCEAGRIRHHLKNNIEDGRNTILLPGFQADGTLGRRLADGAKRVNIFHEEYQVRAEVVQIHGFSGHADQTELLAALTPLKSTAKKVFLVHGEPDQSGVLAEKLRGVGFQDVTPAQRGLRVTI